VPLIRGSLRRPRQPRVPAARHVIILPSVADLSYTIWWECAEKQKEID
jgi:hypothetical protein